MKKFSQKIFFFGFFLAACLLLPLRVQAQATTAQGLWEEQAVNDILHLVNEQRAQHHAQPLKLNPALMRAAQERLSEIKVEFSHYRPDGRLCFSLLQEDGIKYRVAGENIVRGIDLTPQKAVALWVDSPTHCYNIRRKSFTATGIAACRTSDGMVYYIQILARLKK